MIILVCFLLGVGFYAFLQSVFQSEFFLVIKKMFLRGAQIFISLIAKF